MWYSQLSLSGQLYKTENSMRTLTQMNYGYQDFNDLPLTVTSIHLFFPFFQFFLLSFLIAIVCLFGLRQFILNNHTAFAFNFAS